MLNDALCDVGARRIGVVERHDVRRIESVAVDQDPFEDTRVFDRPAQIVRRPRVVVDPHEKGVAPVGVPARREVRGGRRSVRGLDVQRVLAGGPSRIAVRPHHVRARRGKRVRDLAVGAPGPVVVRGERLSIHAQNEEGVEVARAEGDRDPLAGLPREGPVIEMRSVVERLVRRLEGTVHGSSSPERRSTAAASTSTARDLERD